MKNEIILGFCIWDFADISPNDITNRLGIQPTKVYIKGEKKNPKFASLAKKNGWIMSAGLDKYASFEAQMNAILDVIEQKIDAFSFFAKNTIASSLVPFLYITITKKALPGCI
jgi:hypothetical protein